jgi:protein subunit release factor B
MSNVPPGDLHGNVRDLSIDRGGENVDDQDIPIPETDLALLAECEVETFRAGGPGGQHQNTTDSAVRLRHVPTGVTVTCRRRRSQHENKRECLARLRERLEALNERPAKRVRTKPSRSARQRRLTQKRRRSQRKRNRRKPEPDGW